MAHTTNDVEQLLQIARNRCARTREMKSKLEPHRAFIIAAVSEGLPVTTVQTVLEEHCKPQSELREPTCLDSPSAGVSERQKRR
jgi:hypothetical protein